MVKNKPYNTTELDAITELETGLVHRDRYAHLFRWTHALRLFKAGQNVLDLGCGHANLMLVLKRNRHFPARYLGVDVRPGVIKGLQEKYSSESYKKLAEFRTADLCEPQDFGQDWHLVTCFEVLEHVGKARVPAVLDNIARAMGPGTVAMVSTPCYDPSFGAAKNHVVEGIESELTREELKALLEQRFEITAKFGTMANQRDYKELLSPAQKEVWEQLKTYYDGEVLSAVFAPLFPDHARNCLWILKKKVQE